MNDNSNDKDGFRNNTLGIKINDRGGDFVFIRGNELEDNGTGLFAESDRFLDVDSNTIKRKTGFGIGASASVKDFRIIDNDLRNKNLGSARLGSANGESSCDLE